MKIRVKLYDAHGNHIETFEDSPKKAAKRAAEFIYIHGSDPEEKGRGAMEGSVVFEPVWE